MRRLAVLLMVALGVLALGPGAAAGTSVDERIAEHRREIRAKIAEHRAEMRSARSAREARTPRNASRAGSSDATGPSRASVRPDPGPSSPASGGEKVIEILISSQRLRAWHGDDLVLQTAVSTGKPGYETPRGRFSVLSKERRHWSTQYHVWMPYAMRVVRGIFIHEVPVRPDGVQYGAAELGRPVSAGCIRVGVGSAKRLYDWARVGTTVLIR